MSTLVSQLSAFATNLALIGISAAGDKVAEVETKNPAWASGFTTMLGWASWFALCICVLGVVISGGAMALASRRGEGGEHATRLGWVLMGCILIGSASAVVNGVLGAA